MGQIERRLNGQNRIGKKGRMEGNNLPQSPTVIGDQTDIQTTEN